MMAEIRKMTAVYEWPGQAGPVGVVEWRPATQREAVLEAGLREERRRVGEMLEALAVLVERRCRAPFEVVTPRGEDERAVFALMEGEGWLRRIEGDWFYVRRPGPARDEDEDEGEGETEARLAVVLGVLEGWVRHARPGMRVIASAAPAQLAAFEVLVEAGRLRRVEGRSEPVYEWVEEVGNG